MDASVAVKRYRPRQQSPVKSRSQQSGPLFSLDLSAGRWRSLAATIGLTLVIGLAATQLLHSSIAATQNKVAQLRERNSAVADENVRLLAQRAQMTSKNQMVAKAGSKLNLFEPGQGQVHRM